LEALLSKVGIEREDGDNAVAAHYLETGAIDEAQITHAYSQKHGCRPGVQDLVDPDD